MPNVKDIAIVGGIVAGLWIIRDLFKGSKETVSETIFDRIIEGGHTYVDKKYEKVLEVTRDKLTVPDELIDESVKGNPSPYINYVYNSGKPGVGTEEYKHSAVVWLQDATSAFRPDAAQRYEITREMDKQRTDWLNDQISAWNRYSGVPSPSGVSSNIREIDKISNGGNVSNKYSSKKAGAIVQVFDPNIPGDRERFLDEIKKK